MPKNSQDKLQTYLALISASFDINEIITENLNEKEIQDYYLTNHLAYLLFHNKDGFMHMGISTNGKYSTNDFLEQPKIIQKYITEHNAKTILELGSGNGVNGIYLAKHNPSIQFRGLDLSKKPLKNNIKNYTQDLGDYHNLSRYTDKSIDLIFNIESLCHSSRKEQVLAEVYKKLKKNGIYVIFDGYTNKPLSALSEDEKIAKKLTEKTMAVNNFEYIEDFDNMQKDFTVLERLDLSENILPSLKRIESLAKLFFKHPVLTRMLKATLPDRLTKNAIAGLLMHLLIERKVASYYLHVLTKNNGSI